jgi:NitT/TauT family transport system ATP-binding protein
MRQRVALARTLVIDPEVLLFDEPFAALDFQTKLVLESDMARLVRKEGRSLLMITHDVEEAVSLSDRVIVLTHRPSRIRAVHDIDLETERGDMMAARESPRLSITFARSGANWRSEPMTVHRTPRRGHGPRARPK